MAGAPGVIIAYALSGIVAHPVMIAFASKHGFKCWLQDFMIIIAAIASCLIGWWLLDAQIYHELSFLAHEGANAKLAP